MDMCKQALKQHEKPALHCLPGLSSVGGQHRPAPDQAAAQLGTCLPTCNRSSSLLAQAVCSLLKTFRAHRLGRGAERAGAAGRGRQHRHTHAQRGHTRGPSQRLVARVRAQLQYSRRACAGCSICSATSSTA